ncbi:small cysteine-rich protein 8-like [Oculina patagonica]
MAAKFHLCLLMIILGTISVQGARLGNQRNNPMHVLSHRQGYGSLILNKRIPCHPYGNCITLGRVGCRGYCFYRNSGCGEGQICCCREKSKWHK